MTENNRRVTCIPAREVAIQYNGQAIQTQRKRVAAYCRVSTEEEEQQSSFETQVAYYTQLINSNPDWKMVGVFADEGISGTQTKKRTEFLKLMQLCEEGKVDLILVKSISRFARNTLDALNYVRKLKEKNIAIIFEKENINTLDLSSEMILTLYSSFAQAESESISKNITWAIRKEFKQGKVRMSCANVLGYTKSDDGSWVIVPEEARVIRMIDIAFLSGMSMTQIKVMLEKLGAKTARGNSIWHTGTIQQLLKSEKYVGDVLLQKTFVADVLTHKVKKNEGELPQYYVKDHHPAIRSRETAYLIQAELARRNTIKSNSATAEIKKGKYSGKYALTGILVCGECGTAYRRVTWARNGKKKVVWRCINRLNNGTEQCKHSPSLEEGALQESIMKAINRYITSRDELQALLKESLVATQDIVEEKTEDEFSRKIKDLEQSMMDLSDWLDMNKEDGDYIEKLIKDLENELEQLYQAKVPNQGQQIDDVQNKIIDKEILQWIEQQEGKLEQYNDMLVRKIVKRIVVVQHDKIEIEFQDGKKEAMILSM